MPMSSEEYKIRFLNKKYFQKSTFFLYPLLKISKIIVPVNTYIYWDNLDLEDRDGEVIICQYKSFSSTSEKEFESLFLLKNPLFLKQHLLEDDTAVYIFSLDGHKDIMRSFREGKYSKFPDDVKRTIITYYKPESHTRAFIKSYLYPDNYYELYAKLLNISSSTLKEVGELVDAPNIKKETLIKKIKKQNNE